MDTETNLSGWAMANAKGLEGLFAIRKETDRQIALIASKAIDAFSRFGALRGIIYYESCQAQEDGEASITYSYASGATDSIRLPISLIVNPTMEGVTAYKAEEERKVDEASRKFAEENKREAEERERSTLARLIEKYGGARCPLNPSSENYRAAKSSSAASGPQRRASGRGRPMTP